MQYLSLFVFDACHGAECHGPRLIQTVLDRVLEQITKALLGIQDSFEAQIEKLRNVDYTVLDVTTSRWHDDYNSFKDVVKDLEARST